MGRLNVDDATYRALNRWSWSTAKHVLACPAEARDQRDRPIETTPAMQIGTLIHAMILEPDTLTDRYAVVPEVRKGLQGYTFDGADQGWRLKRDAEEARDAGLGGRIGLTRELISDCADRCGPVCEWMIHEAEAEGLEVAMVGDIEGAAVKGKADVITSDAVFDVKSLADCSPRAVQRAAVDRGWLGQLWTYGELARQSGYPVNRYGVIVVQAPRASGQPLKLSAGRQPRASWRLLWLDDAAAAYGEAEARKVWRTIRDCEAAKSWPDYDQTLIELPRWARAEEIKDEAF